MDLYSLTYDSISADDTYDDFSNTSMVNDIYQQNQKYEKEHRSKNWIPDDIMLTTQEDIPIIYINSPKETPEIYPVKLATITLNAELPIYFNLKVVALYLPIDDKIVGIKCEHVAKRGWLKAKAKKKKAKVKGRKDRHDFYNQCTINVRPYGLDNEDIMINMKFFPNGKIGFTGVKRIGDAEMALRYVLEQIDKLEGVVIYPIKRVERGNAKNFRTKLKQKLRWLDEINARVPEQATDWQEFIDGINTKGPNPYPDGIALPGSIGYDLTFLEILFDTFKAETEVTGDEVQNMIEQIRKCYRSTEDEYTPDEIEILSSYLTGMDLQLEDLVLKNSHASMDTSLLLYQLNRDPQLTISQIMEVFGEKYDFDQLSEIKDILTKRTSESPITLSVTEQQHVYQAMLMIKHQMEQEKEENGETEEEDEKQEEEPKKEPKKEQEIKIKFSSSSIVNEEVEPQKTTLQLTRSCPNDRFVLHLKGWSSPDGEIPRASLMDYYNPECINISNINTTFNTNFILSRSKLYDILIHKYHQSDCSFEPNYGGINLKFISVVDCPKHDDMHDPSIYPEYDGCRCKYVSILIFSNITLITGGRSYYQIMDAYDFIRQLLLREFTTIIKVNKDFPDPLDKYPNIIATDKSKYLKKKFILDNPKNRFLLTKLGLLDDFDE